MRTVRIALVAFVLAASAPIARADDPKPEDVVGTWRGKATWKDCAVAGGAQGSVEVTWKDGAFHVDLAGARDDLGDVALSPRGDGTLAGARDDLKVTWKVGASAAVTLATDACTATLVLARDGSKLAACDRYVALASIEATCDAAGDQRAAHLTAARGKIAGWKKLAGKARKDAEQVCTKDADALAETLTKASCLPPAGRIGSGVPECDAYIAVMQRFAQCSQLPVQSKQALLQAVSQMGDAWKNLPPESRQAAADACKQGADALRQSAAQLGCQI